VGAAPAASAASYVVVAGDTLWGIAARMKTTLPALLDANGIEATSLILPGQRLAVPAGGVVPAAKTPSTAKAPSAATKVPAAADATATTSATSTYVVVSGDYLFGIARRFAVPFGALLSANDFTATSPIFPGTQLTIPAGATTTPAASPVKAPATTAAPASTTTTAPRVAAPITPPKVNIPATGNAQIDAVLAFTKAQLGKPYVFAADGPDSYDCSGLVAAAYAQVGVTLFHQSGMQSTQGTPVDITTTPIQAGDLIFTAGSATPGVISHVGIAIDAKRWIQATRPGAWVSVGMIPAASKILAVRRYIA
jgi:LysM repeat protein